MSKNINFKHLGALERYVSKFIARFKGNTIKKQIKKVIKKSNPLPETISNADHEVAHVSNDNNAKIDVSNDGSDSKDSTAFISDEDILYLYISLTFFYRYSQNIGNTRHNFCYNIYYYYMF